MATLGDIPIITPVANAVSDAVDAFGDLVSSVPGAKWVAEQMGDFAKTPVGMAVTRALASSFYGSVAWTLGPQLASITFALPGLMRGDSFDKAWFDEVKWRTEQTAEILGGDVAAVFGDQLVAALKTLADNFGVGNAADWTAQQLARAAGSIREDVSRLALDKWNSVNVFSPDDFDPTTGRQYLAGFQRFAASNPTSLVNAFRSSVVGRVDMGPSVGMRTDVVGRVDLSNAPAPVRSSYAAVAPPRNGSTSNVALFAVIAAAGAALYYFYR